MIKKILKIEGMNCSSCAISIEMALEDAEGIKKAPISFAREESVVEFDEKKISLDKIKQISQQLDYHCSP